MSQRYCIQCTDLTSGQVGDFLYDEGRREEGLFAISPVFGNLVELFEYCREQNIEINHDFSRHDPATISHES